MQSNLRAKRSPKRATLTLIVLLSICAVGCWSDDPKALQSASGKFSFQEVSTYEYQFRDSRWRLVKQRHKVILLNEKLSKTRLTDLARQLFKAYPDTSFDFFDDESQVSEYAEWERLNNGRGNYLSSPLREYVLKHHIAEIKLKEDYDRSYKWFLVFVDGSQSTKL